MGELHARSWIVEGTSGSSASLFLTASYVVQRGVGSERVGACRGCHQDQQQRGRRGALIDDRGASVPSIRNNFRPAVQQALRVIPELDAADTPLAALQVDLARLAAPGNVLANVQPF
jgi:hypothetical protein